MTPRGMSSLIVPLEAITLSSIFSVVVSLRILINHDIIGFVQHGASNPCIVDHPIMEN